MHRVKDLLSCYPLINLFCLLIFVVVVVVVVVFCFLFVHIIFPGYVLCCV